ncbi:hypothetical protein [Archangium violaceum]|uniref:hypothetical protein n=1 Tax=Archangium violaceum TaxID=83451 RepID=UPI001EF0EEC0|nr:hypothetical protein [Archangium violaceum]
MMWNTAMLAVELVLASCGGSFEDAAFDESETSTFTSELNSPIYDRARAYAAAHPKRDGASWDQWCGSLMWRFGQLPESSARPSAIEAYQASSIVSTDASKALTGAFHWWDIGAYGHRLWLYRSH